MDKSKLTETEKGMPGEDQSQEQFSTSSLDGRAVSFTPRLLYLR
jgi:hypothetical protein